VVEYIGSSVDSGESLSVQARIDITRRDNTLINSSPFATKTYDTKWRVVKFLTTGTPTGAGYSGSYDAAGSTYDSAAAVCGYYGNSNYYYNGHETGCVDIKSGNETFDGTLGGIAAPLALPNSGKYFADDVPVGTKVCYALAMWPATSYDKDTTSQATQNANDAAMQVSTSQPYWRFSQAQCVEVGKKPKVEILGAGMNIPGFVSTSQTVKSFGGSSAYAMLIDLSRRLYGSWSEYETVAGGEIKAQTRTDLLGMTGTATGAGTGSYGLCTAMVTPCGANSNSGRPEIKQWSRETITNSNSSLLGHYVKAALPTIASRLSAGCTSIMVMTCANTDLSGGWTDFSGDKPTKVWAVSGNAVLNGNILYGNGTYDDISKLPQAVIIVNGDLTIAENVTQIDAWVIVSGTLNTCGAVSSVAGLRNDTCAKKLVFNGPVSAGNIKLMRTAGSGVNNSLRPSDCSSGIDSRTTMPAGSLSGQTVYTYGDEFDSRYTAYCNRDASGDPAEVFNLRADAYMWAFNQSLLGGQARTTYVREVAPRY
jgi:hypothetical protein